MVGAAWLFASCRPPSASVDEQANKPGGCTFGEKRAAACEALRRGILMGRNHAELGATLTTCRMDELTAEASWTLAAESPLQFQAVVRFGAAGSRDALRPVAVDPILLEWPTRESQQVPATLRVAVAASCSARTGDETTMEVPIARIGPGSCTAQARLTGGDPTWCTREMLDDEEHYIIREYGPFGGRLKYQAAVSVAAEARLTFDGADGGTARASSVRELLKPLWGAASQVPESCRDGSLQVVEARAFGRWKAILRSCSRAVDLADLRKLFRSG